MPEPDSDGASRRALGDFLAIAVLGSPVKRLMDDAFADTLEFKILKHLACSTTPSTLGGIAGATGSSRYDLLWSRYRVGRLRSVVERLVERGVVEKCGNEYRPRYRLDFRNASTSLFWELYRDRQT